MTRIVDAFLYNNEERMLQARLRLLDGRVDRMVLVEGDRTFQGEIRARGYYPRPGGGIERHLVELPPGRADRPEYLKDANWQRERIQRDAIADAIVDEPEDTIVLISDVDELIDPLALQRIVRWAKQQPMRLEMAAYYYSLAWKARHGWRLPMAMTAREARSASLFDQRISRRTEVIRHAGWHCSYFGGRDAVEQKLKDFAHSELTSDPERTKTILDGVRTGTDPNGEPLQWVDVGGVPERLRQALA